MFYVWVAENVDFRFYLVFKGVVKKGSSVRRTKASIYY